MADSYRWNVEASMKRLYKNYIRNCRRRNHFFELTVEQFHQLTSAVCTYCKKPPSKKSRSYKYNGIDRKDNKKGYTIENCVSCCTDCNWLKGSSLNHDEMMAVAQALSKFRQRRI
jgi:hypothetical protein